MTETGHKGELLDHHRGPENVWDVFTMPLPRPDGCGSSHCGSIEVLILYLAAPEVVQCLWYTWEFLYLH